MALSLRLEQARRLDCEDAESHLDFHDGFLEFGMFPQLPLQRFKQLVRSGKVFDRRRVLTRLRSALQLPWSLHWMISPLTSAGDYPVSLVMMNSGFISKLL